MISYDTHREPYSNIYCCGISQKKIISCYHIKHYIIVALKIWKQFKQFINFYIFFLPEEYIYTQKV